MMRQMPNMVHDDPNTVTVEPGQTRELTWRFDGEQPVVFACNIPGHAEARMVATATLKLPRRKRAMTGAPDHGAAISNCDADDEISLGAWRSGP